VSFQKGVEGLVAIEYWEGLFLVSPRLFYTRNFSGALLEAGDRELVLADFVGCGEGCVDGEQQRFAPLMCFDCRMLPGVDLVLYW
jgi:hypothetical protein